MADNFHSVFDQTFNVAVVGTGYAGFAAAMKASLQGSSVLFLDHRGRGDLIWESGRAFATDIALCEADLWKEWLERLDARQGCKDQQLDGAIAEIVATTWLQESEVSPLYYAVPVSASFDANGLLGAVTVASKSGLGTVRAERWIDTTDEAVLATLCGASVEMANVTCQAAIFASASQWASDPDDWKVDSIACKQASTMHADERRLIVTWSGNEEEWWSLAGNAIKSWQANSASYAETGIVSHMSVEPLVAGKRTVVGALPANLVLVDMPETFIVSDRFAGGAAICSKLDSMPAASNPDSLNAVLPSQELVTDVCVAGAGTGGAIAALAAARKGAQVICLEPMSFAGGIGSGGGIHTYYFGYPGGLQTEVDERVSSFMECLSGHRKQMRNFHPDAKKIVLAEMLNEAGVNLLIGATLFDVETDGDKVVKAWVAMLGKVIVIKASSYIDATGDGDLAAMAGADSNFGREGDGLLHAYSQSSGKLMFDKESELYRMCVINFDAGWVDPTNIEDLTRGRLVAISQYVGDFSGDHRPTYIAPAIGLRQGRQIRTDYMLGLKDIITKAHFEDAIGWAGAHYDNHAVDYSLESDDGMFWVWACECWRHETHSELPYRMLVPKGVSNVLLACRAAGVSEEAHHSFRMQRDIQRIAEVAGIAAALAPNGLSREVDIQVLQQELKASGALNLNAGSDEHDFGCYRNLKELDAQSFLSIEQAFADLKEGKTGAAMWVLADTDAPVDDDLAGLLQSRDRTVSWLAAAVLAKRGDSRAEARLLKAVRNLEPERESKMYANRYVPRWLVAVALLRCCGTAACLSELEKLVAQKELAFVPLVTIARTAERLVSRLGKDALRSLAAALDQYRPQLEAYATPQYVVPILQKDANTDEHTKATAESHLWQFDLLMARLGRAVGMDMSERIQPHLSDSRALVRRIFQKQL